MSKGRQLYVEGSLSTRKYQDKEGNDRYITEIRGRNFAFLGGRNDGEGGGSSGGSGGGAPRQSAATSSQGEEGFGDMEDIPF